MKQDGIPALSLTLEPTEKPVTTFSVVFDLSCPRLEMCLRTALRVKPFDLTCEGCLLKPERLQ